MLTIHLIQLIALGLALLAWIAYVDFSKAKKAYRIERKGRNWVVRDCKGRFVRITRNPFDIFILGASL